MPTFYSVNVNMARGGLQSLSQEVRRIEARRSVRMFLAPENAVQTISDSMIPDYLVTDEMIDRYLEITPPPMMIPEFVEIVSEIEKAYVAGNYFSATSAACVTIERVLNHARIELHPYHQKIEYLWNKGPSNEWEANIDALAYWGYLDKDFAAELSGLYKDIRCKYLHSGSLKNLPADAKLCVDAAYRLLSLFLGFPTSLFRFENGALVCTNEEDPLFKAFYQSNRMTEN
jgi:hypothetical protein